MKKTKNQKGITLIALVITIIVMLILIGVTINVAIQGGLFETAQNASAQTNLEKEKEILQSAALGFLDNQGRIDINAFVAAYNGKTIEGYTITKDGEYAIATKGDTVLYIDKHGGISETNPQGGENLLQELAPLIGKSLEDDENSAYSNYENEEFIIPGIEQLDFYMDDDLGAVVKISYKGETFLLLYDPNIEEITDVINYVAPGEDEPIYSFKLGDLTQAYDGVGGDSQVFFKYDTLVENNVLNPAAFEDGSKYVINGTAILASDNSDICDIYGSYAGLFNEIPEEAKYGISMALIKEDKEDPEHSVKGNISGDTGDYIVFYVVNPNDYTDIIPLDRIDQGNPVQETPATGQMTWAQFAETYGNVTLTFSKVST